MGLWQRIRNYFVTDVEVILEQSSDEPFRETASSTGGGGALTTFEKGNRIRYVFHGGNVLGPGSYVWLEKGHREILYISCGPFGAVHLVRRGPPGTGGINVEVSLPLNKTLNIPGGPDLYVTARRFRHKDFELFPDANTSA